MHLVEPRINLVVINLLLLLSYAKCMQLASLCQLFVLDVLYESVAQPQLLVKYSLEHLNFLTELLRLYEGDPLQMMACDPSQVLPWMLRLPLVCLCRWWCLWLYQIIETPDHIVNLGLLKNAIYDNFINIRTAIFEKSEEKVLRII
jgi:hypothetical protein